MANNEMGAMSEQQKMGEAIAAQVRYPNPPDRFTEEAFDQLLVHASKVGVSDLTFQPDEPVWAEVGSNLVPLTSRFLIVEEVEDMARWIYGKNAVNQIRRGEDLDPSYQVTVGRGERYRFRCNIVGGESSESSESLQISIRIISATPKPLSEQKNIEELILKNFVPQNGVVLVCGTTGSGKSTLIAGGIADICLDPNANKKIVMFEAPPEFTYHALTKKSVCIQQHEVGRHIPSFAKAIRNAMRRAPKVIVIGEIRDPETNEGVIAAADSGHIVYSTLHAGSVAAAFPRMVNLFTVSERGSKMYEIIEVLRLVVVQRLVRRADGKGRIALREILVFTDEVRERLRHKQSLREIVSEIGAMVETQGQSFLKAATEAFDRGDIDREILDVYQSQATAATMSWEEGMF